MCIEDKWFDCVYFCIHYQFWDKAAGIAVMMNDCTTGVCTQLMILAHAYGQCIKYAVFWYFFLFKSSVQSEDVIILLLLKAVGLPMYCCFFSCFFFSPSIIITMFPGIHQHFSITRKNVISHSLPYASYQTYRDHCRQVEISLFRFSKRAATSGNLGEAPV